MCRDVPMFTRQELRRYLAAMPWRTRWKILRRGAHHQIGACYILIGFFGIILLLLGISYFIEPAIGTLWTGVVLTPVFAALVVAYYWFARLGSELALVHSLNSLEPTERSIARASLAAGRLTNPKE